MYIGIAVGVVVVVLVVLLFMKLSGSVDNDLLRIEKIEEVSSDGIEASGKIVSLADDDMKRGSLHLVSMELEITPKEGESFMVSKQFPEAKDNYWEITSRRLPLLQENAILPMKVHSDDPSWYFFDFEIEDHLAATQ